ncbi:MAG: CD0415/CD1112 family protein, partial [Faecalibacterium sp.]|nr:CD0415/CD1112 family protein [Faecalibacterium sp.]
GILTAGIMSNLSGLFDDVNTQVGNIAQQVGTKPSSFEPRVFAMIEALSRNVVLPIAGIILTFIACYELIEMITQHNNMAQFEPALIMRWIFKTAVSVWFISNTFDIVMAVFDITQKVVSDSSGIIAGNTRVNDIGLSMLEASLMQMDVGPLFGLFLQSFFIGITMRILSIIIFVIVYHANIHKALKYAVKIDLIPTNPADKVERPKKNEFKGSYYSADEIHALTEIAEGTKLEIPVLLASFYGLRRSEVLGLKWDAIDFEANTLEIKHIVTQASIDGKKVLVQADRAKTKSSLRTLPLVPPIRDRLLMLKGQQDTYRRLCGKSYNREYLGYLCVDEIGNIIRPNYVSEQFPKLLEKNGLRPIRFHDLRHSCASLLLANGVPMKQIQEWLGHSDFSTTANIYAHLDYASKLSSAQAMLEGLGYGNASA